MLNVLPFSNVNSSIFKQHRIPKISWIEFMCVLLWIRFFKCKSLNFLKFRKMLRRKVLKQLVNFPVICYHLQLREFSSRQPPSQQGLNLHNISQDTELIVLTRDVCFISNFLHREKFPKERVSVNLNFMLAIFQWFYTSTISSSHVKVFQQTNF